MFSITRQTAKMAGLMAAILWVMPANAQVCIDSDGDGWGWDGAQSCRVLSTAQAPVQSPGQSACVDTDGDGYGWDGQASCLVGQTTNQPASTPATSASQPVTSTSTECVDEDGDGWGWDGAASCRVSATSGAVEAPVVSSPEPTNPPPVVNAPVNTASNANGFDRQRDLVAIHFDHAPDRDDGHAAVAALMMTNKLDLNVQVVAGTYGEYSKDRYDQQSEAVMATVWGSNWLNAHSNREAAVSAAVNRWSAVLASGGDIWIAEGGPSDFTAQVVGRINQLHTEFDTSRRIHLVQHSSWNEDHALASALNYTRANTRYIRIDDGNHPNATADLRFESHNNGPFVARALSSRYSAEWTVAFGYLDPSEKLDFSDAVELLYIVGISSGVIADVNDFGEYFF